MTVLTAETLGQETERERTRRAARDRIATGRRQRDHAALAERAAPLGVYYSGRWRYPLQRLPAGPTSCPSSCPWCQGGAA